MAANDQTKFKVDVIYGYCRLNSWFEPRGNRLVGMGSITQYDKDGHFVSHKVEPTGAELVF